MKKLRKKGRGSKVEQLEEHPEHGASSEVRRVGLSHRKESRVIL